MKSYLTCVRDKKIRNGCITLETRVVMRSGMERFQGSFAEISSASDLYSMSCSQLGPKSAI